MRVAISPALVKRVKGLPVVIPIGEAVVYDLTFWLSSEDSKWVTKYYRRLSPFFLKDVEDLRPILQHLQQIRAIADDVQIS